MPRMQVSDFVPGRSRVGTKTGKVFFTGRDRRDRYNIFPSKKLYPPHLF